MRFEFKNGVGGGTFSAFFWSHIEPPTTFEELQQQQIFHRQTLQKHIVDSGEVTWETLSLPGVTTWFHGNKLNPQTYLKHSGEFATSSMVSITALKGIPATILWRVFAKRGHNYLFMYNARYRPPFYGVAIVNLDTGQ